MTEATFRAVRRQKFLTEKYFKLNSVLSLHDSFAAMKDAIGSSER